SDRDTLALAARQLVRSMTRTALEAQALEQLLHTGAPYLRRDSRQNQGQLDILERGQPWNQVERLEDEADLARPRPCQLVVVQRSGLAAIQQVGTGGGPVEQAEHVQQRRLARARRAH